MGRFFSAVSAYSRVCCFVHCLPPLQSAATAEAVYCHHLSGWIVTQLMYK